MVLTDVLNWKTIEKSYEDLCKRFGNDALLITSHQKLLNKFIKEAKKLEGAQTNINEILFNELRYLRYRILLDVISRVPINKSYKSLCEMIGNIDYPVFEFWYYRFYNGQLDLDYDRSKDPKPLTFSDLPVDVIEKIIDVSELKPRYILRGVSRRLQNLIDSSKLVIGRISFIGESCPISVVVGGVETTFPCQNVGTYLESDVCRHLSTFFENPKLQLGYLDLTIHKHLEVNVLVHNLFKSMDHQLYVKNLRIISSNQNLMDFIRCLKPRVLEYLEIECDTMDTTDIRVIADSEQWKQAEEITIIEPISCDLADFFHFKYFCICLESVSMENILQLRDGISKSSNFGWCRITTWNRPSDQEIQNSLGLEKQVHNEMEYLFHNIPNSTDKLKFCLYDDEIFIYSLHEESKWGVRK